jgi:hypothetical protein
MILHERRHGDENRGRRNEAEQAYHEYGRSYVHWDGLSGQSPVSPRGHDGEPTTSCPYHALLKGKARETVLALWSQFDSSTNDDNLGNWKEISLNRHKSEIAFSQ